MNTTTKAWKQYQQQSAAFFLRLGLNANIEHKVEGARAEHQIDVYVEGTYLGINFKWVVECKAWKSNISKEKVLALISIVDDIGADKGILLSEKGFQSGAIRSAEKSNIVLTSLADLAVTTGPSLGDAVVSRLYWRSSKVKDRLFQIKHQKYGQGLPSPLDDILQNLVFLELPFRDAANGQFPLSVHVGTSLHFLKSLDDFIVQADLLISEAERLIVDTSVVA